MIGDADHDERSDHEAQRRAADGAQRGGTRPERVRPQHRHGPEHHPEAVLDTLVTSTTATARASPIAPRSALRNQTERNEKWERSRCAKTYEEDSSAIPRRRSMTASAPAASSAASATISVAMPSARAWNPGSSEPARSSSPEGSAGGAVVTDVVSDALSVLTSASSSALISCSSRRVDSCTAIDVRRVLDWVPLAVADEGGGLMERLGHLLGDGPRRRGLVRPVLVADHRGVAGDPFDAAHELGDRHGTRGGASRWIGGPGELLAQALPVRTRRPRMPHGPPRRGCARRPDGPPPRPRLRAAGAGCRARAAATPPWWR